MMMLAAIKRFVAEDTRVPVLVLESPNRSRAVVRPRQVVMLVARRLTDCSYPMIGRHLGGRDHTTIMHGVAVMAQLEREDSDFAALIERVTMRSIAYRDDIRRRAGTLPPESAQEEEVAHAPT